jgi:hypothetical protein
MFKIEGREPKNEEDQRIQAKVKAHADSSEMWIPGDTGRTVE